MGLRLHAVAPSAGARWVRQGFALWWRRPLRFIGLFGFFLFGVLLLLSLPWIGPLLGMATLPLLTLGFMIASRSTLDGGPVQVAQFAEGLRVADPARRRAQLLLCGAYALGSAATMLLADWIDGGLFEQLQMALASSGSWRAPEVVAILEQARLSQGMLARLTLMTALAVPFWHAPALVHWGGQSFGQALFSSTLALWRARGAFVVYSLVWALLVLATSLLALLLVLAGIPAAANLLVLGSGLVMSVVFYVSLWFSFADSFGDDATTAG